MNRIGTIRAKLQNSMSLKEKDLKNQIVLYITTNDEANYQKVNNVHSLIEKRPDLCKRNRSSTMFTAPVLHYCRHADFIAGPIKKLDIVVSKRSEKSFRKHYKTSSL